MLLTSLEESSSDSSDTGNGTDSNLTGSVDSRDSWGSGRWGGGDVGGWDGAWTSDSQGGGLSDGDGLVVDNNLGWLWAVGGVVGNNNVGGDGDVRSNNSGSNSSWDDNLRELHCKVN